MWDFPPGSTVEGSSVNRVPGNGRRSFAACCEYALMKDILLTPVLVSILLAFTLVMAALGASEASVPTEAAIIRSTLVAVATGD